MELDDVLNDVKQNGMKIKSLSKLTQILALELYICFDKTGVFPSPANKQHNEYHYAGLPGFGTKSFKTNKKLFKRMLAIWKNKTHFSFLGNHFRCTEFLFFIFFLIEFCYQTRSLWSSMDISVAINKPRNIF